MGRKSRFRSRPRHAPSACESAPATPPATVAVNPPVPPVPTDAASPEASPKAEHRPQPQPPVDLCEWRTCGVAVTGIAHVRLGLPCQDAVCWQNAPRPILALSDGAGSAAVSELGAAELVHGMRRLLITLEDDIAAWLDAPATDAAAQSERWAERLLAHAQGLLADLAQRQRRPVRELRATLLLAVVGTRFCFWWQVGDGVIVARKASSAQVLSKPAKREFANQTCFVDIATKADVQHGLLPSHELFGLALLSDGGAEKLVAYDGSRVAGRLDEWFTSAADGELGASQLVAAYHQPQMLERSTLDDRSIAVAARTTPKSDRDGEPFTADHRCRGPSSLSVAVSSHPAASPLRKH